MPQAATTFPLAPSTPPNAPRTGSGGGDAAGGVTPDTTASNESEDIVENGVADGAESEGAGLSSKFAAEAGPKSGAATAGTGTSSGKAVGRPLWKRPAFVAAAVGVVAVAAIVGGVVGSRKASNNSIDAAASSSSTSSSLDIEAGTSGEDDGASANPAGDEADDLSISTSSDEDAVGEPDPSNGTEVDSVVADPTSSPSLSPSSDPTLVLSSAPSVPPTGSPSGSPTFEPTSSPTIKTSWETPDPPDDPPNGYFDYDPCEEDRRRRKRERRAEEVHGGISSRLLSHMEDDETNTPAADQEADELPELSFTARDDDVEPYSLNLCEGDCDDDEDCQFGLVCMDRDSSGPVPGCSGDSVDNVDYCVWPEQVRPADPVDAGTEAGAVGEAGSDDGRDQAPTQSPSPTTPSPTSLYEYCYDSRDGGSGYGPPDWGDVSARHTPESIYWSEYSEWIEPSLTENVCDDSDSDRQSPIDLSYDYATAECEEYHEIKDKKGDYVIDDFQNVKFEIHPTKLRVAYHWDSEERDRDNKDEVAGPSADIPKGWGDQLPVLHVDIKTPSEHTIEGKRFAMEYQIFLIQNWDRQRGAPAISVLFDIDENDVDNYHLQDVLDMWQWRFDADRRVCDEQDGDEDNGDDDDRRQRRRTSDAERPIMGAGADSFSGGDDNDATSPAFLRGNPDVASEQQQRQPSSLPRDLQQRSRVWDIWHPTIFRSPWFFGYEGSLTEPPCTEFIEWRIIDVPAYLSSRQLRQIKSLIFDHVDPSNGCAPNTQFHRESVARPTQPLNGRKVHKCTCRDYLPKVDRDWYERNRCWEGDEHVFHERVDGHWLTSPDTRPDRLSDGVWNCDNRDWLSPPCCGRNYDPFHECCEERTC